jgi:transposase-like protein
VPFVREGKKTMVEVAGDLGVSAESVRNWVLHYEIDAAQREGLRSAERKELQRLRLETQVFKGYYDWRKRGISAGVRRDVELAEHIAQIHPASSDTYGAPGICAELALGRGNRCSNKRVWRG